MKRQRTNYDHANPSLHPLDLNTPSTSQTRPVSRTSSGAKRLTMPSSSQLKPLPTPVLLLELPSLLMHPPNHHLHPAALILSRTAVKKLLTAQALSPDVECRAWTIWAEIGICTIDGGWYQREDCKEWAGGIVGEVRGICDVPGGKEDVTLKLYDTGSNRYQ